MTKLDSLAINEDGRIDLRFIKDGMFVREARAPGQSIADLPAEARAEIEAVWTPQFVADFQAAVEAETQPEPLTIEDYRLAIQEHVDAVARARHYDSGVSLASYVASTNPLWSAEAQAFVAWRDAVWAYAYTELDKVMAGERAQPTIAEFIAELPAIEWPA